MMNLAFFRGKCRREFMFWCFYFLGSVRTLLFVLCCFVRRRVGVSTSCVTVGMDFVWNGDEVFLCSVTVGGTILHIVEYDRWVKYDRNANTPWKIPFSEHLDSCECCICYGWEPQFHLQGTKIHLGTSTLAEAINDSHIPIDSMKVGGYGCCYRQQQGNTSCSFPGTIGYCILVTGTKLPYESGKNDDDGERFGGDFVWIFLIIS